MAEQTCHGGAQVRGWVQTVRATVVAMGRDPLALAEREAGLLARRSPAAIVGVLAGPDAEPAIVARGRLRLPDGPPATPQTLVEIGSITKVVTATALADAAVRGEVTLETPVRDLLPSEVRAPEREGVAITLEQLATHTSGLPRSHLSRWTEWFTRDAYPKVTDDDIVAALPTLPLKRMPGTGTPAYSNYGMSLLGVALARRTGYPDWASMVAERVLEPLGMDRTSTAPGAELTAQVATGHRSRRRRAPAWRLTGFAPAGGLLSDAGDVLRLARAQLHPDDTALAAAIRMTQARRHVHGRSAQGLGWVWTRTKEGWVMWHNGGTAGFRTFLGVDLERDNAVVVLLNRFSLAGGDLAGRRLLRDLARG